jgi:hypothetical protein
MRRSCHADFRSPLSVQVGLNAEVGSFPAGAGNCEAGSGGCEAAMVQIQSGWVGVRCASVGVRAATDDVRDRSAGRDRVPDDYINVGEEYQQLQSSYHAGRCECRGMSSDYIVGSAAYDGALPVVSTRADEYSVSWARYHGSMSAYIGLRNPYDRRWTNDDVCLRSLQALLQFKRPSALSSKRDRVSSFEDTQLACLAGGRHHPDRPSPPDPGGWRSSTEGSDHATAICAGGGMLDGGMRRRR